MRVWYGCRFFYRNTVRSVLTVIWTTYLVSVGSMFAAIKVLHEVCQQVEAAEYAAVISGGGVPTASKRPFFVL